MTRAALAVAALLATGCGDDVDLSGVYEVTSAVASMPCGADTPITMPPAYLKFYKAEFFGAEFFTMSECTDAAGTDCSGGGLLSNNSFSEPFDRGWRGVVYSAFSGGDSDPTCTLVYTESTATLAGTQLAVEATQYSTDVDNTDALCTAEEAERRNDSMPCAEHSLIDATKL